MKITAVSAIAIVALPLLAWTLPAVAADQMMPHPMKTAMGMVLTDGKGMTLYTFDQDKDGKSACTGGCVQNWPPLTAGADAKSQGDWTTIIRDDGTHQWAFKGKPLYNFAKDTKPGDTAGDGFKGMWHAATP
jgi:predicted lipoprotein with Yx(FWY)xxD motif